MMEAVEKDHGDRQERVVLQEGTVLQGQGDVDLYIRQMTEGVEKDCVR